MIVIAIEWFNNPIAFNVHLLNSKQSLIFIWQMISWFLHLRIFSLFVDLYCNIPRPQVLHYLIKHIYQIILLGKWTIKFLPFSIDSYSIPTQGLILSSSTLEEFGGVTSSKEVPVSLCITLMASICYLGQWSNIFYH